MRDYPGQACSYIPEQAPEDIRTWLNSYFTMDNSTSYQQVASFSERRCIGLGSLDTRRDLEPSRLWTKLLRFLLQACLRVVARFYVFFRSFCVIPGPILGPFFGPQIRPRFGSFNCKRISGPKSGPNFGPHFGYRFWAPKLIFFLLPGDCLGQNLVPYLGALGLL